MLVLLLLKCALNESTHQMVEGSPPPCRPLTVIILANPKRETGTEASRYQNTAMSGRALLLPCNNSIISMQQANKPSLVSVAVCSYFGRATARAN